MPQSSLLLAVLCVFAIGINVALVASAIVVVVIVAGPTEAVSRPPSPVSALGWAVEGMPRCAVVVVVVRAVAMSMRAVAMSMRAVAMSMRAEVVTIGVAGAV